MTGVRKWKTEETTKAVTSDEILRFAQNDTGNAATHLLFVLGSDF